MCRCVEEFWPAQDGCHAVETVFGRVAEADVGAARGCDGQPSVRAGAAAVGGRLAHSRWLLNHGIDCVRWFDLIWWWSDVCTTQSVSTMAICQFEVEKGIRV